MDPRHAKSNLHALAKVERGILRALRRAAKPASGPLIPKGDMPTAYPPPAPIEATCACRRTWSEPGVIRVVPVTTLCRAIAINQAILKLQREGFRHIVLLDIKEGNQ